MVNTTPKKSKKTRNIIEKAQAHIQASFNNTIVTITDEKWNALTWATWWSAWFKWAREATPYAAQVIAEQAISKAVTLHWVKELTVYVKWIWVWREQAIRWLLSGWVEINSIFDITPVPHNGCRKKKLRKL